MAPAQQRRERPGTVRVTAVHPQAVSLSSGERLGAATVVWCAGMRASSLTEQLPVVRDRLGRVPVDSCQHGRPMGRYAGYNVISDLFDKPMLALRIPWYVTVLDLGPAGAVYTEG